MSQPLISCILLTRDRPQFVPQAIESYRRQDWENKELIVWDTGSVPADIPDLPGVTVYRGKPGASIGALRNSANARAKGWMVAHWDDDDWSAPDRLTHQADILMREDADVVAYRTMYFRLPGGEYLLYRGDSDMGLGTSLLYKAVTWQKRVFRDISQGEDFYFIMRRRLVTASAHEPVRMIARHHDGCTPNDAKWRGDNWKRVDPFKGKQIESLLSCT